MYKEIEIVIRNSEDDRKLQELIAAGWQVFERGYLMLDGEPTRAIYKLCKELDGSTI